MADKLSNSLSDAIAEITTKTTGTITKSTATSGGTLDNVTLYKIGKIVFASGRVHSLSNIATNNTMFIIPEGFRPAYTTCVSGYFQLTYGGSDLGSRPTVAKINTNGNVEFTYSATATTNQVYFSGSWAIS